MKTDTSPKAAETPTEGSDMPTNMPTETPTKVPTKVPTNMPTETPTETGQMPTKIDRKIPCEVQIINFLSTGEKQLKEIYEGVQTQTQSYIRKKVRELHESGKLVKVKHGRYALNADVMGRTEDQNEWTVNLLLNLYDKEIAKILSAPQIDYEELESIMNSLYRCAMVVERSLKRWYLVHRGYDANTRQAQEDAKKKTAQREKQELENAPPEEQLEVVGDYDESMRELLEALPEAIQKKVTV